eukprot:12065317-Alexandrium_andersonii.AAC.1
MQIRPAQGLSPRLGHNEFATNVRRRSGGAAGACCRSESALLAGLLGPAPEENRRDRRPHGGPEGEVRPRPPHHE